MAALPPNTAKETLFERYNPKCLRSFCLRKDLQTHRILLLLLLCMWESGGNDLALADSR